MTDLFVDSWGAGTPVVLVHGSLATGGEEWQAQRPLADRGFRLLVPDRRGYGRSPWARGEDFLVDAEDIAALLGHGAHIVAHSYGGLGALYAAARRPQAVLSLALLEPATVALCRDDPAVQQLTDAIRDLWQQDLPDETWMLHFLQAVGSDPAEFPPDMLKAIVPLVRLTRFARPPWEAEPPLAALKSARYPKLIVSGGHSAAFDRICEALADGIDASRMTITGAGHEIQFAGDAVNAALLELWRSVP